MIIAPASPDQLVRDHPRAATEVWEDHPARLGCDRRDSAPWGAVVHDSLDGGLHRLAVAADEAGRSGAETASFLVNRDGRYEAQAREAGGSDADASGAWPERHLLASRLGPNRNEGKW